MARWRSLSLLFVIGLTMVAVAQSPTTPPKTSPVAKTTPAAKKASPPPSGTPFIIQNLPPAPSSSLAFKDFLTIIAAVIAGGGAIGTALIARKTAERKRESDEKLAADRLAQDKVISERKETADREIADAREQREAMQFAKKEMQDHFVDIENHLASSEPMMRANAALRLAEFGTRLTPRTGNEMKDQTPPRNAKNNPYFIPVASQLATALHLESNAVVRRDMVKAISDITKWAREEPGQELLHELIHRIAEANRTAKDAFIRSFAEYSAASTEEAVGADDVIALDFVASIAPFCTETDTTKICLQALKAVGEQIGVDGKVYSQSSYTTQKQLFHRKRKYGTEADSSKDDALILPMVETTAKQLIDIRDAMATALLALVKPENLPDLIVKETSWGRPFTLNLSGVFLSGAKLGEVHLQGAEMSQSELQGADLMAAQLQKTTMSGSRLQMANLSMARMYGANLSRASLQDAFLYRTFLQEVNFIGANLNGANLEQAELQGANLFLSQLLGADLRDSQMHKTNLYGVLVQSKTNAKYKAANFTGSNWSQAEFLPYQSYIRSDEASKRTKALQDWLRQFPEMASGEVITYETWKATGDSS